MEVAGRRAQQQSGGVRGARGLMVFFVPGWLPSGSPGVHGNQVPAAGALVQRSTNTKKPPDSRADAQLGCEEREGLGVFFTDDDG